MTALDTRPAPPPGGALLPGVPAPRRRRLRVAVLVVACLLVVPAVSYAQALRAPGGGSWQVRSVEWVRDHGGAGLVNWVENWWYAKHEPPTSAPAAGSLPRPAAGTVAVPAGTEVPAPIPALAGVRPLPGEGQWVAGRSDAAGIPAVYTTFVRPDAEHASVVAGVAWMRSSDTVAHLVAGTQQPGGSGWAGGGHVPAGDVPSLVATFNSGWKFRDIHGGFYLDGRTGQPLVRGVASAVIDDRGHVTIGAWGSEVRMTSHVRAVRQNLAMVVDGGRAAPGLTTNLHGLWGSSRNQFQYTWRSGLGTDAHGNLVYVAGSGLTLETLARAMVDAGIQRGMELDIHSNMASFSSWQPGAGSSVVPTKLLPGMQRPATRYLTVDQRDFFYLTVR
jgi:hypothetical protein